MEDLGTYIKIGMNINNDFKIPAFKTISSDNKSYEVRSYEATKFASIKYKIIDNSNAEGKSKEFLKQDQKKNYEIVTKNIMKLMKYTQGDNDTKTSMQFLMPVFVEIEKLNSTAEKLDPGQYEVEVTILLGLPEQYQHNKNEPPKPLDNSIDFVDYKEFKCFVRTFSGYANDEMFKTERIKLSQSLADSKIGDEGFDKNKMVCIAYDPPYKPLNRRNEVWLYCTE